MGIVEENREHKSSGAQKKKNSLDEKELCKKIALSTKNE